MKQLSIIVRAIWDDEAGVYVATTSDLHGLAVEAATLEHLCTKVLDIVPELLELNGIDTDLPEMPVHIISEQVSKVRVPRPAQASTSLLSASPSLRPAATIQQSESNKP
jgi:hypothetical protein